eukprot:3208110-Pyramimonas_sp.AAC.1
MALPQGRLGPLPARRLHALRPTARSPPGIGSRRAPAYSAPRAAEWPCTEWFSLLQFVAVPLA